MKPTYRTLKRIFPVLLLIISPLSGMTAENPPDHIMVLRERLKSADDSTNWSRKTAAYVELMHLGDAGFRALSDSWAYDRIPEENWLQWESDMLQRYGNAANNEVDAAYADFLNRRMANQSEYAAAAARRLLRCKIYSNEFLMDWLRGAKGARRVGYMALSQKYPDIPSFDYEASPADRSVQLEKVRTYLELK
jgi:hypothetical protein